MGNEERQFIIGKTVEDYNEAKKNFEAITVKAATVGRILREIGTHLEQVGRFPATSAQISSSLEELPERKSVLTLMTDLDSTLSRRTELYNRLCRLEIEPRD